MDVEKKSGCKRVDVGVIYECALGLRDRCKYYEESKHGHSCVWYRALPAMIRWSSCSCKEAIEEAERDKIIIGGIG